MHCHSAWSTRWFIISFGRLIFAAEGGRTLIAFSSLRFRSDQRELPVLWHQSLLSFIQHYRQDVSTGKVDRKMRRGAANVNVCSFCVLEQKKALLELLHHQFHHTISNEIRQLLAEYKCRDEEDEDYAIMDEAD